MAHLIRTQGDDITHLNLTEEVWAAIGGIIFCIRLQYVLVFEQFMNHLSECKCM